MLSPLQPPSHRPFSQRSSLVLPLVVWAAGACIAELPTPTDRTADGRYVLTSVEGRSLPFSQIVEGGIETIHSGFIEFGVPDNLSFNAELNSTFQWAADSVSDEMIRRQGIWMQYDDELLLTYFGHPASDIALLDRDEISLTTGVLTSSHGKVVQHDGQIRTCIQGCDWDLVFAR